MEQVKSFTDYIGLTSQSIKQPEQISWCLNIINCGQNIITWVKENPWTCVFLILISLFLFWFCTKYNIKIDKKKRPRINKSENFCRSVVEKMFNQPFPSVRPDWLNNSETGKNLELDMYNDKLKLAVERDGEAHYKYIPFFHKSVEDFEKQKDRDRVKDELCKKIGITLIRVPYHIKKDKLKEFIIGECEKKGVKVPRV